MLTTDAGYWDALTAAGIAGLSNAPVLMTAPTQLSSQTNKLLNKLKPKTIIICGGPAVVSNDVATAASKAGGGSAVKRIYGQTMTDTANEVFKQAPKTTDGSWNKTAFVATSNGYWDALVAAPISYKLHMPIFLTKDRDSLSGSTLTAMKGKVEKVYIVGGTAVVANSVEEQLKGAGIIVAGRLWGQTAIDTSVAVAKFGIGQGMSIDKLGIATQNGYWDALSGAALCGKNNSVLVLVDGKESASISGFVAAKYEGMANGYLFGGKFAISNATLNEIRRATPKTYDGIPLRYDWGGYDQYGYDPDGYNSQGYNREGYDRDGYDINGYDRSGRDREGYDRNRLDRDGYDEYGYDQDGYNRDGFDWSGYDRSGYDSVGYDWDGYDRDGYDRDGYNQDGFDEYGYNRDGYDWEGYDREGFNRDGYNWEGYDKYGYDRDGYDEYGYDRYGYDQYGRDWDGYDRDGYDWFGYDRDGYDRDGFNEYGYDRNGNYRSEGD